MQSTVKLRDMQVADLPLVMAWRSHPLVYSGFVQQKSPLEWGGHLAWHLSRRNWKFFIIQYQGRDVGGVNFGQLDHHNPELGYYLGETTLWGKGITTEAVKQALEWLKGQGYEGVHTTVKKDNKASIKLLQKLGFEFWGDARMNEVWMQKRL